MTRIDMALGNFKFTRSIGMLSTVEIWSLNMVRIVNCDREEDFGFEMRVQDCVFELI